jgi:hypothetical protein
MFPMIKNLRISRTLAFSRNFSSRVNPIAYAKKTTSSNIPPPPPGKPSIFRDVDWRFVPLYAIGIAVTSYAAYTGYNWMISSLFSPSTIPGNLKVEDGNMIVIKDGIVVSTLPPIPVSDGKVNNKE